MDIWPFPPLNRVLAPPEPEKKPKKKYKRKPTLRPRYPQKYEEAPL